MEESAGRQARRRIPHWAILLAGYSISVACLIWVYRGFDWKGELPRLIATDWRWITVAVVADILVYVLQAWRWNLLLQPLARMTLLRTVQAIYIGLFANEVLPLRSGEVIRCYLLSRWRQLPFSLSLSSAVVERLLDGAWLVLGFYVVTYFVALPGFLVAAANVLALALAGLGAVLAYVIFRRTHAEQAVAGSRWSRMLHRIVDGLHTMGRSRSFVLAVGASFFYLALQVVPIYALLRGFGLGLPAGAAFVILVILRLGSIPPQAPGNVGSFQFFTILGLQLFGVGRADATGFATLLFIVVTVPLWLVGFVALIATGMRLGEIHRHAREKLNEKSAPMAAAPETNPPPAIPQR
jgi:uncharacterized protein (TIRG00374 family)